MIEETVHSDSNSLHSGDAGKWFILNDRLLKNGPPFGRDYFDEQIERIQEIRISKRNAHQKVADVFEQCSCDYDKNSDTTKAFYTLVWNMRESLLRNPALSQRFIDRAAQMAEQSVLMRMNDWMLEASKHLKGGEPD